MASNSINDIKVDIVKPFVIPVIVPAVKQHNKEMVTKSNFFDE